MVYSKTRLVWWLACLACYFFVAQAGIKSARADSPSPPQDNQVAARQILAAAGVQGGLIAHLGCGNGKLTAGLRATGAFLVHGLDLDPKNVEAAQRYLQSLGLYGPVSVDRWACGKLPYVDNLINLLVVEKPEIIARQEMLRVLAPNGVAYLKTGERWTRVVKPRPPGMDEWNQYLRDASNNAVSQDNAIGPPRHVQWYCGPAWSRHHDHMASLSAMVSANGRIFYIMDEGPREAILLPSQWSLLARDAFNGTILWKRSIPEWNTQLWPLKSGPNQLPRRLVAVGNRVYVTLGIDAPLTALDAATGQTLLTFPGTAHTEEILASDETLFLVVGPGPNQWKEYRPKFTYVWSNSQRANSEWAWQLVPRSLVAVDAQTGSLRWKQQRCVAPLTVAADGERMYFYDGDKVVALKRTTGAENWTSAPIKPKRTFPTGYGPTLVVQQGVVLVSVENRYMTALSAGDGKTLWMADHHPGGHASPDDMLVIDGLVWSGAVAAGKDSGVFTGRDLQTGEVKSRFLPDVSPDWFHHRCYRSRATQKYVIASRTGLEFIDLQAQHWDINHWVRGGCLYGFMPANGFLYVPPHSCGCFLESKLMGFNVLAGPSPSREVPRAVPENVRREQGPAYDQPLTAATDAPDDWPTYRHDAARSGSVQSAVPAGLKRCWQTDLGGKLSSPVVSGNRVFLAAIDRHTVYALKADSGQVSWSFTAGGRVDSPPTVFKNRVLFGSADGWVYCLHADNGQLIWRFRAAPQDRLVMSCEQLESAWPVSGSVLVQNNTVYLVAGRSAFLDGGLRLIRLNPETGRLLSETIIDDKDPETGKNLQTKMKGQDMPVALPDILSSDGRSVFMRAQAFDLKGVRRTIAPVKQGQLLAARAGKPAELPRELPEIGDHLFSRTGFLDDSWFFRSYWMYGKAVDSNYGSWMRPGHFAPSGRLLVFDDSCVYAFARKPEYLCNASVQEYFLYRADRSVPPEALQRVQAAAGRINAASPNRAAFTSDWNIRKKFPLSAQSAAHYHWALGSPPIQARGLVLAGKTLFVAGPPDLVDEEEAFRKPDDPAIRARLEAQVAALQGRKGGQILALSADDGKKLGAYELGTFPVFDGMIAARGRLFLATLDGKVLCLGGEGTPLPAAPDPRLLPLDTAVKPVSVEPPPHGGSSLAGDFARVVRADVTRSDLGYHLRAQGKAMGFAVKQLPAPLVGKIVLRVRMKATEDGDWKNAFLLFGDRPGEARLVKCGLRFAQKRAVIVQGPLEGSKPVQESFDGNTARVHDVEVTLDLPAGQVVMKTGEVIVKTTLTDAPAKVSFVGYGAANAGADFSQIEIGGR